ncbi:MAG: hypothetical protein H6733_08490 [Alphaproteobacteria bacterium]|nr:hypothetical protein [Alphaproteobacteria bacterium]
MAARPAPAFVTGTSSEYLGKRPLRHVLRERPVVFVLGPRGVGKSAVARRIAGSHGHKVLVLEPEGLADELVRRTRAGVWSDRLLDAGSLLFDCPAFLTNRPAVVTFLRELLRERRALGRVTMVCASSEDGSIQTLMHAMPPGSMATVGLRFPASRSGRMRFARRQCDALGLARSEAQGTDLIEPWSYDGVIEELRRRRGRSA